MGLPSACRQAAAQGDSGQHGAAIESLERRLAAAESANESLAKRIVALEVALLGGGSSAPLTKKTASPARRAAKKDPSVRAEKAKVEVVLEAEPETSVPSVTEKKVASPVSASSKKKPATRREKDGAQAGKARS